MNSIVLNCPLYWYEGKDSNLKERPCCFSCRFFNHKIIIPAPKCCSSCQIAWYCSAECQDGHFGFHRYFCKHIVEKKELVRIGAVALRNAPNPSGGTINPFETLVGFFDEGESTRAYLESLFNLANSYWLAAYESEIKEVWEKALFCYSEILRLNIAHQCDVRFRVPLILLYLNRDDDAYSFIRYWINFEEQDDTELFSRHERSREGDWVFPLEPNCRFLDIFEECSTLNEQKYTMPFLVAMVIIKLRIIASHEAISQTLDFVFQKTSAQKIQEVRPILHHMLAGCDLTTQRQQLRRLLDKIQVDDSQIDDSSVFDFFRRCEHISENRNTRGISYILFDPLPFPRYLILENSLRCFFRVPGALDILGLRG
ncbi:hypothetical protein FisN_28Hu055 [Fistulifera solaris]|uniref:MYND-type domain-containing protein n=1 Tax=Fistulifera solaris TaxID=1519565 RepID=A0A1Z5KHI9_FISSO|nr:hypothetical protein FisN_28Hu055 [Fistulifera solaris]|eukprot:GAX25585.1 hypothetical protein FisN_28Hu055 [Fistulifera solaris]